MDAILLDTDVFSFLLRQGDTRAERYRPLVKNKTIALSFISVGELYVWSVKRNWSKKKLADFEEKLKAAVIVPYDLELCREYARVVASLPSGRVIPTNDLWIAVCAIRHSIPLLSNNRKDFEHIPRLQLLGVTASKVADETGPRNLFESPSS